ncbi:MAG: CpaF family protein [Mogibacterium sp.]|nr:CpaF family protein [Mogibacterium sp.]
MSLSSRLQEIRNEVSDDRYDERAVKTPVVNTPVAEKTAEAVREVRKPDVPASGPQNTHMPPRPMSDKREAELSNLQNRLLKAVAAEIAKRKNDVSDDVIKSIISEVVSEQESPLLNRQARLSIMQAIYNEIVGLGPLEALVMDPTVSEIMVNGPNMVFIERAGKLVRTDIHFQDDDHVRRVLDRIVSPLGRHIDDSVPMVDARLKDGSRVNAIIPPLALNGSTITIRKFSSTPLTVDNLISFGSLDEKMSNFLQVAVEGKLNILVSGGTGSGKTTLLNVLSAFIPADERIVTIEDAAELRLMQEHVVSLESRPANIEGTGAVTIRDLVRNALRMRPDRIVVGEVRGGETLDMLQAMNTGHDGSMTTAHANTPRDAISRVETMVMMSGMELPVKAIRQQIAGAFDLIVQQARFRDGSRRITSITEVVGMEGDIITTQELFRFVTDGYDANRKIVGHFEATGIRPMCLEKIQLNGANLDQVSFV